MSDDPETARQIAELSLDDRPLLVLDVDDVLLEFIRPFPRFVASKGFEMKMTGFQLNGSIFDPTTGEPLAKDGVAALIDEFFRRQAEWQELTAGAADALASFGDRIEIVMLTAMPHRYRDARRAHLDELGLPYPLLTTEQPKGPAVRKLRGEKGRPVAFVDDIPHNHVSVRRAVADSHLFHLMADTSIRPLLPPLDEGVAVVEGWHDAAPMIAEALRIG